MGDLAVLTWPWSGLCERKVRVSNILCRRLLTVHHQSDHFEALELQLKSLIETASIIIHSHSDFRLSLELYYTSKTSTPSSPEVEEIEVSQPYLRDNETSNLSLKIRNSRPDLDSILGRVVDVTAKGGVGVGVCGPSGMVETMEKLVRAVSRKERQRVEGVEIHSEAFSL